MKAEIIKLDIIDRLLKIRNTSSLEKLKKLITQLEMESRINESLEAIEKEEVLSIEEFKSSTEKWLKKKSIK
ncbi:MAG: hypothetical protein LAT68_00470 [Cyclobacteriaceae bacterium]|nr:hypothetical protein [Cyclobacteriaceae bacterium]MCH8514776.1 hypothetical protein [Cyclobacteriaceae bacterium]